jgi:hypothetical protein
MTGCQSFPQDLFQANDFLRLGLIEKAVYEITYEAANRPDWVHIPIDALIVLLDDKQWGFDASTASLSHPSDLPDVPVRTEELSLR